MEGCGKKEGMGEITHCFQLRLPSPFTDCFEEPEHSALQRLSWILPGDILKVGQKVRAPGLDIIEL